MALLGRLTDAIRRIIRDEHLRTWDRNGGPGAVLRVAMRRPLVTAIVVAVVLGAVLVVTFGVPPYSPLGLIVLVVAPIVPWLRAEQAVYAEWLRRADAASEPEESATTPDSPAQDSAERHPTEWDPDSPDVTSDPEH